MPRQRSTARHVGAFALVLVSACSRDDTVLVGRLPHEPLTPDAQADAPDAQADARPASEDASKPQDLAPDADTRTREPAADGSVITSPAIDLERGPRAAYCSGHGPALRVIAGDHSSTAACHAQLSRRLFAHALCTCQDVTLSGSSFSLDAFDARHAEYRVGGVGAPVGINGSLLGTASTTQIGGSLSVEGPMLAATAATRLSVAGDLRVHGELAAAGASIAVARDAYLGASPAPGSRLAAGRALVLPPGVAPGAEVSATGRTETEAYRAPPPCACGSQAMLDIEDVIARAAEVQDNTEVGLGSNAFAAALTALPVQLECGRFVLDEVTTFGNLGLTIPGRTALFVRGDFTIAGNVLIDPGAQGELDVFVGGNLSISTLGIAQLGSAARPGALRFYVAGAQPIRLLGLGVLAVQLYAPHAPVEIAANTAVYGSIFASSFSGRDAALHYDRSVVELGESCSAPDLTTCLRADDCALGLSCRQQHCTACSEDDDCTIPAACSDGRCGALQVPLP
jgi:hypothetical protein